MSKENKTIFEKNPYIVPRTIHGTFFLVNIGDNYAGDRCALHEVNQTGIFLWNQIDGRRTSADIAVLLNNAIVAEEFLASLKELAFVEVVSHG